MASIVKIEEYSETIVPLGEELLTLEQSDAEDANTDKSGLEELSEKLHPIRPGSHPWQQPVIQGNPVTIRVKKGFQVVNDCLGVFPCKICSRQFSKAGYLVNHMQREHSNNCQFTCETCGGKFDAEEELVTHILHVHFHKDDYFIQMETKGETKYKCKYCGKLVKNKDKAEIHEASHVDFALRTKRFEARTNQRHLFHCLRCTRKFALENFLKDHVRQQHLGDRYPCKECGRSFRTFKELSKHKTYYATTGENKASAASAAAKEMLELEDITRSQNVVRTGDGLPSSSEETTTVNFTCTFCVRAFSTKTSYHQHLRQSHGDEMGRDDDDSVSVEKSDCKICEVLSRGECDDDYFQHIKNSHTSSKKTFQCRKCAKEFPSAEKLKGHMLFHEVKAWKCIYCQDTFPDVKTLKTHMEENHAHMKTDGVFLKEKTFLSLDEAKRKAATMTHTTAPTEEKSKNFRSWSKKPKLNSSMMSTPLSITDKTEEVVVSGGGGETLNVQSGMTSSTETTADSNQTLCGYQKERGTYVCNNCPFTCDSKFDMSKHVQIQALHKWQYVCPLCPKQRKYKHLSMLRQHMERYHGNSGSENLKMIEADDCQQIGNLNVKRNRVDNQHMVGIDNLPKVKHETNDREIVAVKTENLTTTRYESTDSLAQSVTSWSGESESKDTFHNGIILTNSTLIKLEPIDQLLPAEISHNLSIDSGVKMEDIKPETVIVKKEIEDKVFVE